MSKSPQKKKIAKNEWLVLSLTLVLTGGLLLGAGWWVFRSLRGLNGESLSTPKSTQPRSKVLLKVLGDTFSGYSTLRDKTFQQALKQQGIELQYRDEFIQKDRAIALSQKKAELIVTTLDQFLTHQPPGKIVALIDRTVGADAIVLNTMHHPELKSLLDLETLVNDKAKTRETLKIVFAGDTPSEFLALVLNIKFEGFNLSDFEIVKVDDASRAWTKMQQNSTIALGVLWEPYVTEARSKGNTVVLSSKDAPQMIIDVMVASDRILQANPEIVRQLVETYYQHIDASIQEPTRLIRQIAADGNLEQARAQTVMDGIHFFTSLEAKDWMESGQLEQRISSLAALLALSNRSTIPANPQALYSDRYLSGAATKTRALLEILAPEHPELVARLRGTPEQKTATSLSSQDIQQAEKIGHLKVRGEVKFQTGSARLTDRGQQTLNNLAREIGEFSAETIAVKVQGHTSRTGTADFNRQLSEQRARVVADYLKSQQLPHHFFAEGLGFSQPLPGVDPSSGVNQRTVILLIRVDS
ncbi:MAG: OmpA family protein [Spirulina sp.]